MHFTARLQDPQQQMLMQLQACVDALPPAPPQPAPASRSARPLPPVGEPIAMQQQGMHMFAATSAAIADQQQHTAYAPDTAPDLAGQARATLAANTS